MSEIHPLVYISIGGTVGTVSYFLPGMQLFMYLGAALCAYGILRLIIRRVQKTTHVSSTHEQTAHKKHMPFPTCSHCKKHIHTTFLYCPYCGHRLP